MNDNQRTVRIGGASGFWGDSSVGAPQLVKSGQIDYLVFDYLAELTMSILAGARLKKPELGYATDFVSVAMKAVLKDVVKQGIRVVSNAGGVNPQGCADALAALAAEQGVSLKIAVVSGDDVSPLLPQLRQSQPPVRELQSGAALPERVLTANAYLGAGPIQAALDAGAQIVVCGRVADPSLTVGPAMSHFGWRADDWDRLGRATMAGHLLECGAQVCGGYFADPGYKDVPGLESVGFPIAEIDADGGCVIGKADGTGGLVTEATVKEQLLYEVHDPAAYLTPDVVADISDAEVRALPGSDRVELRGVRGHARPGNYKVNVCHEGGWLAEGEISYAGPRAEARARLATDVLKKRLDGLALRVDLIGALSILGDDAGRALADTPDSGLRDVRLRVAATHADRAQAERLGREVMALYTCGPAGGGGVRTALTPRLNTLSCLLSREAVPVRFTLLTQEELA